MKNAHVIKQIINFLRCFGLDKHLIFFTTDSSIQAGESIIADIYESFIAAVYLIYGIDKASQIVIDSMSSIIDLDDINKSYLEIVAEKKKKKKRKKHKK